MKSTYEIFEKLPDGCPLWRACVSGRNEVERKIQELRERSENDFFAFEVRTRELYPPRPTLRLTRDWWLGRAAG